MHEGPPGRGMWSGGGGWARRVCMVRTGVPMAKTARTELTGFEAEWICIHGNQVSGPFQVDV